MPRDKTFKHIKIRAAAKFDFMEMGFNKSSMRSIRKRCGMMAAGIYQHCVDKADIFDQSVAPAVDCINAWLDAYAARYVGAAQRHDRVNLFENFNVRAGYLEMHKMLYCCTDTRIRSQKAKYEEELHRKNLTKIESVVSQIEKPVILLAFGGNIMKIKFLSSCFIDIYKLLKNIIRLGNVLLLDKPEYQSILYT